VLTLMRGHAFLMGRHFFFDSVSIRRRSDQTIPKGLSSISFPDSPHMAFNEGRKQQRCGKDSSPTGHRWDHGGKEYALRFLPNAS